MLFKILMFIILFVIPTCLIIKKMKDKWWKGLIPFFNSFILYKNIWNIKFFIISLITKLIFIFSLTINSALIDKMSYYNIAQESDLIKHTNNYNFDNLIIISGYLFVFTLIAIIAINMVFMCKLSDNFAKGTKFKLGLVFIPIVFYPILGYGNSEFVNLKQEETK